MFVLAAGRRIRNQETIFFTTKDSTLPATKFSEYLPQRRKEKNKYLSELGLLGALAGEISESECVGQFTQAAKTLNDSSAKSTKLRLTISNNFQTFVSVVKGSTGSDSWF